MTYTLKLLTDAAIAFGQGRGRRRGDLALGARLPRASTWRTRWSGATSGFCGMRWITGAVAEASRRLFGYLSEHSATYFADRFAGALVNKIANAATRDRAADLAVALAVLPLDRRPRSPTCGSPTSPTPTSRSPWSVWMAVYVPVNVFWVSRLHKLSFAYAEASSQLRGQMVDTTTNIDTVQLTGEVAFETGSTSASRSATSALSHLREWWWSEWLLVTNGVLLAALHRCRCSASAWGSSRAGRSASAPWSWWSRW